MWSSHKRAPEPEHNDAPGVNSCLGVQGNPAYCQQPEGTNTCFSMQAPDPGQQGDGHKDRALWGRGWPCAWWRRQRNPLLLTDPAPPPRPWAPLLGQSRLYCWLPGAQSCSVALRVEEVNWAAWEQTLPTVCEDMSGPPVPGE